MFVANIGSRSFLFGSSEFDSGPIDKAATPINTKIEMLNQKSTKRITLSTFNKLCK